MQNQQQHPWLIFTAMAFMITMISIELSAVSLALPSIAKSLSMQIDNLSWVINAYMFTWAIFMIPAGFLGDRFGRLRMFALGTIIFAISAFIGGFAQEPTLLITSRFFQGLGAAILYPVAVALAYLSFDVEERGVAVGIMMLVSAGSIAAGPIIGGFLIHYLSWRWIFFINLPISIICIIAAFIFVSKDTTFTKRPFDLTGLILLLIGMFTFIYGLTFGNQWGWLSLKTITNMGIGIIALFILVVVELKKEHPLLPLDFFKDHRYMFGSILRLLTNAIFLAVLFSTPLLLENVVGLTPLTSGNMLAPYLLMFAATSVISGKLTKKYNLFKFSALGIVLWTIALILIANIHTTTSLVWLCVFLGILGVGAGIGATTFTTLIMQIIPEERAVAGSAFYYLFPVLGNLLGAAISAVILSTRGNFVFNTLLSKTKINLSATQAHQVLQYFSSGEVALKHFPLEIKQQLDAILHHAFISGFRWNMWFYVIVTIVVSLPLFYSIRKK